MDVGDIASTVTAVVALLYSVYQFRVTRRQTRRTDTFQRILEVRAIFDHAVRHDWNDAASDCLAFSRSEVADQSERARDLFALLNALDLLAVGIAEGQFEEDLVTMSFSSAIYPIAEPMRSLILGIRDCYRDPTLYRHLYDLVPRFVPSHRRTLRMSESTPATPAPPITRTPSLGNPGEPASNYREGGPGFRPKPAPPSPGSLPPSSPQRSANG
ncbi:MAG TPA: DUF4760 domain-containing protein [Longimicrobium sp.]|nr:DUF4760 domain-containing protein [Longimicrobium sp.]